MSMPNQYLSYAMPAIGMACLHSPLVVVQGVYAKYYGFSLTAIAVIVLASRVFDAITDPLIGYYSDRYRRRAGTRKPFVLAGGLLMVVSGYFLYVPFDTSIFYFCVCLFVFYLAFTLFEVPHQAWATELASTSTEKSIIYSMRSMAVAVGLALFYMIPLLPFFETSEITPATLEVSALFSGVLMLTMLAIAMKYSPNGSCPPISNTVDKTGAAKSRGYKLFAPGVSAYSTE